MSEIPQMSKYKVWIGDERNLSRIIDNASDVCCVHRAGLDSPWQFLGTKELSKQQLLTLLAAVHDMCSSQGVIDKRKWPTHKERESMQKAQMANAIVPHLGLSELPINKRIVLNPQFKEPSSEPTENKETVNTPSIGLVPL